MFSRGGESDYNLVLIDGVRVNANGGLFDFSRIAAGEIERVEVVRGAQSSLWGSDAMGAVVQVFTRRAGVNDAPPSAARSKADRSVPSQRCPAHRRCPADGWTTTPGSPIARPTARSPTSCRRTTASSRPRSMAALGAPLGSRASRADEPALQPRCRADRSVTITYGIPRHGRRLRDEGPDVACRRITRARHAYTGHGDVQLLPIRSVVRPRSPIRRINVYALLEGTPNALFPNGPRLVRLIDLSGVQHAVAAGATPGPGSSWRRARRPTFRHERRTDSAGRPCGIRATSPGRKAAAERRL